MLLKEISFENGQNVKIEHQVMLSIMLALSMIFGPELSIFGSKVGCKMSRLGEMTR
jgi:hypothetical protein